MTVPMFCPACKSTQELRETFGQDAQADARFRLWAHCERAARGEPCAMEKPVAADLTKHVRAFG